MEEKRSVKLYACCDMLYDIYGAVYARFLKEFKKDEYLDLRRSLRSLQRKMGGMEETKIGEELYWCAKDFIDEIDPIWDESELKIKKLEAFIEKITTYDFDLEKNQRKEQ